MLDQNNLNLKYKKGKSRIRLSFLISHYFSGLKMEIRFYKRLKMEIRFYKP